MHVLLEALIVGLVMAVLGFIISTGMMFVTKSDFSLSKYKFWWQVVLGYFLTGFFGHLIFEVLGVNKKYCEEKLKIQ